MSVVNGSYHDLILMRTYSRRYELGDDWHTGVSRIEPYFGMSSMGESSMGGYGVLHGASY